MNGKRALLPASQVLMNKGYTRVEGKRVKNGGPIEPYTLEDHIPPRAIGTDAVSREISPLSPGFLRVAAPPMTTSAELLAALLGTGPPMVPPSHIPAQVFDFVPSSELPRPALVGRAVNASTPQLRTAGGTRPSRGAAARRSAGCAGKTVARVSR